MHRTCARVWLHMVFCSKNWHPNIPPELQESLFNYMHAQIERCGCRISIINGTGNYIHVLLLHNPEKSVQEVARVVKGTTANWINMRKLGTRLFEWRRGYSVFSVSDRDTDAVYHFIKYQNEMHAALPVILNKVKKKKKAKAKAK